jgi:foldase protein PrsA
MRPLPALRTVGDAGPTGISRLTTERGRFIRKHVNKKRPVLASVRIVLDVNYRIPTFTAVLLAVAGLSACGGGGARQSSTVRPAAVVQSPVAQTAGDRIPVVHVGSATITKGTVDHWISVLKPKIAPYEPLSRTTCSSVRAKVEVRSPKPVNGHPPTPEQLKQQCEQEHAEALKRQVLSSLIASEWVIQEAARDGLRVTDSEAQRLLETDKHSQFPSEAKFQQYLNSRGETVADVLLGLKEEIASEKLHKAIEKMGHNVTPTEIAAYYNTHKQLYVVPEQRNIEAIRTWTKPAIKNAKAEIESGVSFGDVARRVSIDRPSNEHGGVTLGVVRGQEESGFDEAIFAAKPNVLVGPLHLRQRYYIFEVTKITPGRQQSFAEIESSVMTRLATERHSKVLSDFVKAWRKKWTAKTNCTPHYVVQKCRQFKAKGVVAVEDPYTLN